MTEWISVKDKLPRKYGTYLCCVAETTNTGLSKSVAIVDYCAGFGGHWNCKGMTVTHWMTLPKLPEVTLNA